MNYNHVVYSIPFCRAAGGKESVPFEAKVAPTPPPPKSTKNIESEDEEAAELKVNLWRRRKAD